ncbi:MAG: hypothetical protein AAF533_01095 [Acidobacteriota bacterium]
MPSQTAKFAGSIRVRQPSGSEELGSGTHVVVTLVKIAFGKLPEPGRRSELKVKLGVSTSDAKGKRIRRERDDGNFYYVVDNSALNLHGVVLYDGPVHQHLSFDTEVSEVEMPQIQGKDLSDLLKTSIGALGSAASVAGGAADILEAVPNIVGNISKLNGNDQVLKFATSLIASDVERHSDALPLKSGLYSFDKVRAGSAKPWASLEIFVGVKGN